MAKVSMKLTSQKGKHLLRSIQILTCFRPLVEMVQNASHKFDKRRTTVKIFVAAKVEFIKTYDNFVKCALFKPFPRR